MPLNILIADDHAIVRRGLKEVIAEEWKDAAIHETATGQGVLDALRRQRWDALILDINLPDKNGLEVLKDLKVTHAALPVLILSHHSEAQYAARAYKAGAAGYLAKESATDQLASAIRKVVSGGRYVSPSFAEHLASHLSGAGEQRHERLSDREHLVLCLIGKGKTVSEIAKDLALSVNTISTYRVRLLNKLHLKNNADLMHYAIDQHLVE